MKKAEFERKCFEAYKLDWMISHGRSMQDYLCGLVEADEEARANDIYPEGGSFDIFKSLNDDFEERGFGPGTIWVCFDEFLDAEFKDTAYMDHLLGLMPDSKRLKEFYSRNYQPLMASNLLGEAETPARVLRAYKNTDPNAPGIIIMLQPAAYEEEIDVAMAQVFTTPDYGVFYTGNDMDVSVMTWGDATNEDYTSKEVIRREDVIAGLGSAAHAQNSTQI